MDELQLLRDCLPEQRPPGLDVTGAARRRMRDGRRSRRVALAGVRPASRALLLRLGLPTVGVAAAAALVVAVAATVPASAPARPSAALRPTVAERVGAGYTFYSGALPTANDGGTTDGRAVLLTAATQVAKERQPAAERYWVTSGTAGNFLRIGPADDPYTVLDESEVQNWAARSPKDGSPQNARQLGAAPVSAADRAAWARDGSPTMWDYVPQGDSLAGPDGYTTIGMLRSLSMAGAPLVNLEALATGVSSSRSAPRR